MTTYIQTHSGKYIDFLNVNPDAIDINDIAWALARIPRFTGHLNEFYSVADHCLNIAAVAPKELKLEALMHDSAEAYIGDIPTPLKRLLGNPIKEIESRIENIIADKFKLSYPWHKKIKELDAQILNAEASTFFDEANWINSEDVGNFTLLCRGNEEATKQFLAFFYKEICKRVYHG